VRFRKVGQINSQAEVLYGIEKLGEIGRDDVKGRGRM
jgi:hypothetical protein